MIMLMGFKAYDEHDAEYNVTGKEAREVAGLLGHPGAQDVVYAHVTFFHPPLDYAGETLRVLRDPADDEGHVQLDLIQDPGSGR